MGTAAVMSGNPPSVSRAEISCLWAYADTRVEVQSRRCLQPPPGRALWSLAPTPGVQDSDSDGLCPNPREHSLSSSREDTGKVPVLVLDRHPTAAADTASVQVDTIHPVTGHRQSEPQSRGSCVLALLPCGETLTYTSIC